MIFRMYHRTAGGHTHLQVFSGTHDGALGKCGDLTMRNEEFDAFRAAGTFIQFIEDKGRIVPHHGSGPAQVHAR